jgi:hypothetical protein
MTKITNPRSLAILLAALSLASCNQEYSVAVTSERGQVTFAVPNSEPYCLNRLTVYCRR